MATGALGRARYSIGTYLQLTRAASSLRAAAARASSAAELFDVATATGGSPVSIAPGQVRSELARFADVVAAERPERVLEIGTGVGGTLYVLAWASAQSARLLSIDRRVYPAQRRLLYRRFATGRRRIDVLEADSHQDSTRAKVDEFFHGRPLDLVFIDGNHGYESVSRDYELYGSLVRAGGLVAFHDIVDGPAASVGDVPRFWREIRGSLDAPQEIVESWQQGGYGIGVGRRRGD